uniref:Uncharacterized protein n=1 Tax=Setaria digitata TaxID=48799 RepID=A0A915PWI1_9BILA
MIATSISRPIHVYVTGLSHLRVKRHGPRRWAGTDAVRSGKIPGNESRPVGGFRFQGF